MCGKNKAAVTLVSKAVGMKIGLNPCPPLHHSSTPLVRKCLNMAEVLKPVISEVNVIRSTGLNHRQFREFIEDIGENDSPSHTAVGWFSCGNILQRFFD
ncbi:general transcription factor II-I repeat domain-containing protein 2 [Trichonephila clavipes]|nr:general transcription factor II-I repeat domain-containing protein 2 [Trichonephila clavipes]